MVDYDNKVKMPVNGERVGKRRSPLRQLARRAFLVMRTGLCKEDRGEGVMRERFWGVADRSHSGVFSTVKGLSILVVS